MRSASKANLGERLVFEVPLLVFLACSHPSIPSSTSDLIPLQVGNYWVYKTFYFDSTGTVYATSPESLHIAAKVSRLEKDWYRCETLSGKTLEMRNDREGVWCTQYPDTLTEQLLFKYPAMRNEAYAFPTIPLFEVNSWTTFTGRTAFVVSTYREVTVPADTFTSYQYHVAQQGTKNESEEFVAWGIGWVKTDFVRTTFAGRLYLAQSRHLVRYYVQ